MLQQRRHRRVRRVVVVAGAVALITLALAPWARDPEAAYADSPQTAVLDWNLNAINALVNPPTAAIPGAGQTPPVSMLHLAMVQGAVYDAVNMIAGGFEPYLDGLPTAPPWASKAAAVATAAHHVLVGVTIVPPLSPTIVSRLDGLYADSLAAATAADGSAAVSAGVAAGAAAAQAMLDKRLNDGRYPAVPFMFTVGDEAGEWRPTNGVNDPFAWVARVTPFLLDSADQVRTKGPNALNSGAYTKEYNEVKAFGGNGTTTPSLRTPKQTATAQFFVVNPVELFNRTFRGIATTEGLTLQQEARLFAMLDIVGADALIGCWDDKAFWSFWRPVTAIQQGDSDGNIHTVGDTAWTPLITTTPVMATPPYPDHPSGYNCASSAFMHTAEAYFGTDRFIFSLTATVAGAPVTRDYNRFTNVVRDTIDARVFLGIHFRRADEHGAGIGKAVARLADKHFFRPVK
jgi:hypothetical protein